MSRYKVAPASVLHTGTRQGDFGAYTYIPTQQRVDIVAAVPDGIDPHPTNDWYVAKLADGTEIEAASEDFDPIPPVGTGR